MLQWEGSWAVACVCWLSSWHYGAPHFGTELSFFDYFVRLFSVLQSYHPDLA